MLTTLPSQKQELTLEALFPFGLLVQAADPALSLWSLNADTLGRWVRQHKVVVLRGFAGLSKLELPSWCRQLGDPQAWEFGTVNDLNVRREPLPGAANYLLSSNAIPLYWDGAYGGQTPEILFFQCLQAPPAENGGQPIFVDTPCLLERFSESQRQRLAQLQFSYSSLESGQSTVFKQQLLSKHPQTGQEILRYLEAASFNKLEAADQELIAEIQALLQDPHYRLVHQWQDGDYLLADNYALLHGRQVYEQPTERHLRRVNILPRPSNTLWSRLLNSLRLRRLEYLVAEVPVLLIPLLMMAQSPKILSSPVIWEGLLALYLLFNIGDLINSLADRDLDAVYKPKLSRAVYALGVKALKLEILLWSLVGFGLCLHVAWQLDRWTLVPLWLLGLGLAAQYSLPPWSMKSAGIWHFLGWCGILFWGPMLFSSLLAAPVPQLDVFIFAISFAVMQSAILLVNSAEDYPEDLESGMQTVIVTLGLVPGMKWSAWLISAAGALHLALLIWMGQGSPVWLNGLTVLGASFWLWVCLRLWKLKARLEAEPEQALQHIRVAARFVPLYLAVIALGNLAWVFAWSLLR